MNMRKFTAESGVKAGFEGLSSSIRLKSFATVMKEAFIVRKLSSKSLSEEASRIYMLSVLLCPAVIIKIPA